MAKYIRWSRKTLGEIIFKILNNQFDCFIIIEGARGIGKSTLALHLSRFTSKFFRKMGRKDYRFHWDRSLIYTKKQTKNFLHKWNGNAIADEMINVTFNRDFYDSEQKDIIKMLNMNRDHHNLLIACVPMFQNLDNQVKNLCKIRITVLRRGFGIVQTPNKAIYVKDKWDSRINEKIEREWIAKDTKRPRYNRLTTFRGIITFPKLPENFETKYQRIKDRKRNIIAKQDMNIKTEDIDDPVEKSARLLKEGRIRNSTFLDGIAFANKMSPNSLKRKITNTLKKRGEQHKISSYFWEKKAKQRQEGVFRV